MNIVEDIVSLSFEQLKNAIPHDTFCSFTYKQNCHFTEWSGDADPNSAFDTTLDINSELSCKISLGNKIFNCIVEIVWGYPIKDDYDNLIENDCDDDEYEESCRSSTSDFCRTCFGDPFDDDVETICKFLLTGDLNRQLKYEHIFEHLSEDYDSITIISAIENTNKKSHIERSQDIVKSFLRQREDIQFQKESCEELQDELEELISLKLFYQRFGFQTSKEFDDYLILVHRNIVDETKFNVQKCTDKCAGECVDKCLDERVDKCLDEFSIPEKLANLSFHNLKDLIPRDTFCSFLCTNYKHYWQWSKNKDKDKDLLKIITQLSCRIWLGSDGYDCNIELQWKYSPKNNFINTCECYGNKCRKSTTYQFCTSCFGDPFDNNINYVCELMLMERLDGQLQYRHILDELSEDYDHFEITSATKITDNKIHFERGQTLMKSFQKVQEEIQNKNERLEKMKEKILEAENTLVSFHLQYGFYTPEDLDAYLMSAHVDVVNETIFNARRGVNDL